MPKVPETTPSATVGHKKPAARSVAYTAFTITYGKDFTQSIYSHFGGNSFNTRETIAKILKKSPELLKSPISSCVQYGLLEMRSKIGYKPTPRFMDLYKQDDPEVYRNTMIACLKSPPLYINLLEAYKGDIVPSLSVLSNSLFKKHGILETVSEKVASVFLQNLDDLGLIGADRKLLDLDNLDVISVDNAENEKPKDEARSEEEAINGSNAVGQAIVQSFAEKPEAGSFIIEVPLADSRKAKILCPMDVSNRDLKKIIKVVQSYIDDE